MPDWVPMAAMLGLWLTVAAWGYLDERRDFAGGLCCGRRLRRFDTDSQGGRGYTCDSCRRYLWVSWPVD